MRQMHCCHGDQHLTTYFCCTCTRVYDLFVFMWFWEKWCRQLPETQSLLVCMKWSFLTFCFVKCPLSLNDYSSYWLSISACAPAAPLSAKHRTSRAHCLSCTARPSWGSLPWALTPTHTWPLTSTQAFSSPISPFISPSFYCAPWCLEPSD